ncbi:MAG: ATP-binding cassette domain-containing protein [Erysipelotrichaceae bacterium]|nr:ATP-binding cassette domain-containing protein [Erysipelotrichaceae bacterium]
MIELKNIQLFYKDRVLLDKGNFKANSNEIVLIKGKSGCGKTTLLYDIGLVHHINYSYEWNNHEISTFSEKQKAQIRREKISFVTQDNRLNENLTVKDNILYYATMNEISLTDDDIKILLDNLQIGYLINQKVSELSGGEKQRVAVTCKVAKKPELLLLDEPTSQLDEENERKMMKWLQSLIKQYHMCIIITSHRDIDDYVDKIYLFENQKLKIIKDHDKSDDYAFKLKNNHIRLFNHIKATFMKNHFFYLQLLIMICLIPLITSGIIYYIDHTTMKQIDTLNQSIHKYVLSEDYQTQYVELDGETIELFFYASKDDISTYLLQDYRMDGCYISQKYFQGIGKNLRDTTISFTYQNHDYTYDVAGIMNDDQSVVQSLSQDNVIYIPLNDYQEIIGLNPIVTIDSIEDYALYDNSRIIYNQDIQFYDGYLEYLEFQNNIHIIINVLFVIATLILSVGYCYNKRVEWAYQYFDGYSQDKICEITFIENSVLYVVSLLFILILGMNYLIYSFGYIAIFMLINCIMIKRINFINVIR